MNRKLKFWLTVSLEAAAFLAMILALYYGLGTACVLMHGASACR